MEVLLIACMLAYAAGSQNEQTKLGISPAQRAVMRETARHQKAVQKIADKHGVKPPPDGDSTPDLTTLDTAPAAPASTIPAAFRAGWRGHTPITRVATPLGRRAGSWAARGVYWAKDTGRSAVREFREHRRRAGLPDPAPIVVTLPPEAPPMPTAPPTVGVGEPKREGVSLARPTSGPDAATDPEARDAGGPAEEPKKAPEGASEARAAGDGSPGSERSPEAAERGSESSRPAPEAAGAAPPAAEAKPEPTGTAEPQPPSEAPKTTPDGAAEPPTEDAGPTTPPAPQKGATEPAEGTAPVPHPRPSEEASPAPFEVAENTPSAPAENGVGRMATEVSYGSVAEESDELDLMCEDDLAVYERIRQRCRREISKGDALEAELRSAGAGERVIARTVRCREQYQVILSQLDALEGNTIAQREAVVKAKALLLAGQGVYADIAQDMESVAERTYYLGDAVDSDDTAADTETYELKGA